MADTAPPEHNLQPPSTAEEDTPPPPPPLAVEPTATEPPLASVEVEPVKQESVTEAVEHHPAVTVVEKDTPLTEPSPEEPTLVAAEQVSVTVPEKEAEGVSVTESEKSKPADAKKIPESLVSFKEESNKVSDLSDSERKSLEEFKFLVQESIKNQTFTTGTAVKTQETQTPSTEITDLPQEVSIWGIPLLKDDRADVILLKFLRARDFKVKDSFAMLKKTILWRKEFNIEELVDEDLGDDLDKVVFMHGHDKEGHPVCYNVYGEFQNKELYNKTFGDEEKRNKFLRWRIQFLERSIRKLDFNPGGINTIFQVSDLKNSPGPGKRELRLATRQALHLLQDNYPEFVAKQVFINVPWWYLAFYTMISPFMTQRTKSKFVFAGPSKTAETLYKYVSPEQVPVQYGGLSVDYCECNPEFTVNDPATEIIVKPATKQTVEIIVNEKCIIVWELRVLGWDVTYSAEYVPNTDSGYTVNIQKPRKMTSTDEPVVSSSFKIVELGKILLTIDNPTSKKKKLLYRYKDKPYSD
ncbi:patellin-3 [Nicotiana sylvestris]|uniref:Patellin-3 n=1 Tax=Nicotiana sylvestris TaxID=4096 RepID=A0A1U7W355_NICSY|nr:PREDICTED: patellin-3 [Nicotiana sylvestris]